MVQLELPHVNILSKIDLMEQFGTLPFNLDFFMDLQDVGRLLPYLDAPVPRRPEDGGAAVDADEDGISQGGGAPTPNLQPPSPIAPCASAAAVAHDEFKMRRQRLHGAMCELIDDFSLVSFETLNIQDAASVGRVLARVDKANGYVFGATESSAASAQAKYASSLFQTVSSDTELQAERTLLVQERYLGRGGNGPSDGAAASV